MADAVLHMSIELIRMVTPSEFSICLESCLPQIQGVKINYDVNLLTWLSTLSVDGYGIIVDDESPLNSIEDIKNMGRPIVYGATGPSSTSYIATTIVSESLEIPYEVITGYKGSGGIYSLA